MKFNVISCLVGVSAASAVCRAEGISPPDPPKNYAVAMYNSFDIIDVFGPIDVLFYLSLMKQLNLNLIAETLDPVWMRPPNKELNKFGSNFTAAFKPTHTYDNPPDNVEVLIVPGGLGMRFGNSSEIAVDYVRKTYPKLKYLLTICTGAGIAAKAGVLDGKRATTNKSAWMEVVPLGPKVKWVSPARWTIDGNIWTSSGVTSGFDLIFEFIDKMYNKEVSRKIQGAVEHVRAKDACDDPFAEWHKVPPSGDCKASS